MPQPFSIDDTNGQLQTSAALDYETKAAYTVRITVSDGELTDSIDVTINITDVNENRAPVFTDGSATTRSIAEEYSVWSKHRHYGFSHRCEIRVTPLPIRSVVRMPQAFSN